MPKPIGSDDFARVSGKNIHLQAFSVAIAVPA
jgi:hypothetical protein